MSKLRRSKASVHSKQSTVSETEMSLVCSRLCKAARRGEQSGRWREETESQVDARSCRVLKTVGKEPGFSFFFFLIWPLHAARGIEPRDPSIVCVWSVAQSSPTLTPWTVAHQVPCPWSFPGKNIEVGCHFFLQGIFPTQGSNILLLYLLYWQVDSLSPLH